MEVDLEDENLTPRKKTRVIEKLELSQIHLIEGEIETQKGGQGNEG